MRGVQGGEEGRPPGNAGWLWLRSLRSKWFELTAVAIIVFLSVDLIFLISKNRQYEELLTQAGILRSGEVLSSGERLENIEIVTLDEYSATLSFSGENRRYLLFILSTTCPHCVANLPRWDSINRALRPTELYIVGLSLHKPQETADFVSENSVSFYTVTVRDSAFLERYRIPGIPATLLVSEGGIVENVWIGELTPDQEAEVIDHAL